MKVSVVMTVYNAAPYVAQSALDQPQTGQVLLVEDGCPDEASLPTCRDWLKRMTGHACSDIPMARAGGIGKPQPRHQERMPVLRTCVHVV